jgi:hypothetical protein
MRKSIALAITAATTAGLAAFVPATANAACGGNVADVCSGTTLVTATVGSVGIMSIATTAAATLTSTTSPATGSLGLTTVTDTNTGNHNWTVAMKSTDFSLVGAAGTTINANKATAYTGAPIVTIPGTATITSYPAVGTPLTLSNANQNFVVASATNANIVTYTPTMSLDFTGAATGVYTATVTQTLS